MGGGSHGDGTWDRMGIAVGFRRGADRADDHIHIVFGLDGERFQRVARAVHRAAATYYYYLLLEFTSLRAVS